MGTALADINRGHIFNPWWPPHARLHSAAGWGATPGLQLLALWLLWRPGRSRLVPTDETVATAAALPVIAWAPFFFAVVLLGTAVEDSQGTSPASPVLPPTSRRPVPVLSVLGYGLNQRGL